ncbi:SRPBCC domain-containing protein, partial [Salmonella sp. SAL4358]|uniref:SRPBCC domain-containing protein n=1 Tax=Salmonella sp. SAL4358 TaxID=3159879 RepID=UPI00397A4A93
LPATPKAIYEAWLDGKKHTAFTGGGATAQATVGGRHTAWDGYIHGWTLALQPGKRIVQSWRTTEFKPEDPDSLLEVKLAKAKGGTKVT